MSTELEFAADALDQTVRGLGGVDPFFKRLFAVALPAGADQNHRAVFHIGQEAVLLRPVEAVNLIDEQQRPLPAAPPLPRLLEGFAQIRDAGEHRRQRDEVEAGPGRHDPGQRGLAAAGRPPQNKTGQPPGIDHPPQRRIGPEQMILPDDFVERRGPHPVRQRPPHPGGKQCLFFHCFSVSLWIIYHQT